MDAIVHFDNVTKAFGSLKAVDSLNLKIDAGKFVTLLGPSGCGKTTTLRMLGGLEKPTSGRIILAGKDVTDLPPNKRDVNIVFQDYALFPHMNVAKNIAFGLELKGMQPAAIHRRVTELLELVRLQEYAQRMPQELSGGQRQRVALMRALAPDPQVLLLDEPLSALDAKLRVQMQMELKSIQKKTGKTFLLVTHDQEEALTMSDQIVVMNNGFVEQVGDPHALYSRPATAFVANFIGETNFLRGKVTKRDDSSTEVDWHGRTVKASAAGYQAKPGENVSIIVRPEAINCSPVEPSQPDQMRGKVRERVFKGNHTSLVVDVGGHTLNALLHHGDSAEAALDDIWIWWKPQHATVIPDSAGV